MRRYVLLGLAGLVILLFGSCVFGQTTLLPLSGRPVQSGSVTTTQTPVPGVTTSVNTINPTIQTQGPYAGSADSTARAPFSGKLSLREAVRRGLEYNLGTIGLAQTVRQAHGQVRTARSALLPNLTTNVSEAVEQVNLRALGVRIAAAPSVVGPFNYFDLRARLSQTVADLTAWNNYRSAGETLRANQMSALDARDLVVLAVGGAYLQVIAAAARLESARAQLETANTLYRQTAQQRNVGLVAQIDVNRSQVQALTQQQRLVSLQNDFAKQKINLARVTGLPPTDQYQIADDVPFSPAPAVSVEEAVKQAIERRPDLKAADAQVRAAERSRSAARAERLPSLSVAADYGVIGTNLAQSHGTFSVAGTVHIPIWQGGRTAGEIEQTDAALAQRRAEMEDLRGRIESDVRKRLSRPAGCRQSGGSGAAEPAGDARDSEADPTAFRGRRDRQPRGGAVGGVSGHGGAGLYQQRVCAQRGEAESGPCDRQSR
jgi:outer membrane protein TolC